MKILIIVVYPILCAQISNAASEEPWMSRPVKSTTMQSTILQTTTMSSNSPGDYCPIGEMTACEFKDGVPATKNQFPYVVFLKTANDLQVLLCTGSLIHARWVLTSAYCTLPDAKVEVILGALVPLNKRDPDRIVMQSEVVYVHPGYLPHNNQPKNDVALIKLSKPVTSAAIIPIVLKRDSAPIIEDNIIFAGYEQDGYETLTYTNRIMISEGPCRCRDTSSTNYYNDADAELDYFCGLSVEFLCFIHNGGGLVINGALVAVMSTRCFTHCNHMEGTFTNIYKHLQWIDDTLADRNDEPIYRACGDISGANSAVYRVQPNYDVEPFEVYCELRLDGEKWTVIHQRFNKSVDFYKNYANYTMGFGPLAGNHWLGLEKIHQITKNGDHELLVEMQAYNLTIGYAKYSTFKVDSEGIGFQLTISGYSGNAGDSMTDSSDAWNLNGKKFTTFDKDQDEWRGNCAEEYQGAWWYNGCSHSNLNGPYYDTPEEGGETMNWFNNFGGFALKSARMMVRRK